MVFTNSIELAFRRDAILKAQLSKAKYLLCLAWCLQAESSWHFEGMPFWRLSRAKAWYLLCLAEESMIFTSSVELAFRRDAILKAGSSKAWYLLCLSWCLQAQSSSLFKVIVILKVESSKTSHLLCLAMLGRAGFSKSLRFWRLNRANHSIYCV